MADIVGLDWLVKRMRRLCSRRAHFATAAFCVAAGVLPFISGCDTHTEAKTADGAEGKTALSGSAPTPATAPAPQPGGTDPKSFTTTGPLVAEQQADISAERDGRIMSIAVQIGDRVLQGQVLAMLDDRVLRSICEAHKAHIAAAEAEARSWEAEQKTAEADLRRADSMRADKIISEENWEHAKYRVDETIDEVARYRQEELAAEADLHGATAQLEQSRIVAPFNGVVGRSSARLAQEVKAGDVLFWITAEAPLHVLFTVPETAMGGFSSGKALELTTADYPALRQRARILRVSPVVDPASGSVQVVGAVVNPSRLLKPGMTMQVRLAP